VILPGVTIGEGASVGALTLVNRSLDPFTIYAGIPARRLRDRSKAFLELETQWRAAMARPTNAASRGKRPRGRG
jgi:galactoside O-acetyltransferase